MHIAVIHQISDPEKFWGTAGESELPEGITLNSALPNADGSRAVCLWKAESVDAVKQLVEDTVGDVSSNEFFEINAENARGLPG
jgi:hypothetical protein